ncbi:hypothetical protein HPB48_020426 [Haemaphysalis longicornis]|uniref:Uncharacterized protein n=1 Tax=Haemaphysalis longicornis TaxID=44386 RepID=A0A9J6H519_HAELO|nr:hypothetical protein HPB48_020426 [Haemaphysalis longicornis]
MRRGATPPGDKRCKTRFLSSLHCATTPQAAQLGAAPPGYIHVTKVFKAKTKTTRDRSETPHSHRRRSSQRRPQRPSAALAGPRRGRSQSRPRSPRRSPAPKEDPLAIQAPPQLRAVEEPQGTRDRRGSGTHADRPRGGLVRRGRSRIPPRENESREHQDLGADRAADARADKTTLDGEEKQVTHAALPEHVTAQIKGIGDNAPNANETN